MVGYPYDFNGGPIPLFTWLDLGGLRDRGRGMVLGLGIDKESLISKNINIDTYYLLTRSEKSEF